MKSLHESRTLTNHEGEGLDDVRSFTASAKEKLKFQFQRELWSPIFRSVVRFLNRGDQD